METSWERASDFTRLGLEEVAALARPFGLDVVEAELLAEGKANTNYRVRLADGSLAVVRSHERNPRAGQLEAAVVNRVADLVPVARVLHHDPTRAVSVLEWKPGLTMERLLAEGRDAEVVSAAADLGRAVAAISSIRLPAVGDLNERLEVADPAPSAVDWLFGYLRHCLGLPVVSNRLGPELVRALGAATDLAEPRLREVAGPPCLVHGDFKPSNLLVHEGRLSAVLDWEFAHSGTWLFHIAQLFRHPLPGRFEEGFGAGTGPLPEDWRRLAVALDMVNLVDFATREGAGERLLRDVRRLLASTVTAWGFPVCESH